MRRPSEIPGIDTELLKRYPAGTLRALGERLGLEDARAGARVSVSYAAYAIERLGLYVPGYPSCVPDFTADEQHEFICGLVAGLDDGLRVLKTQ